MRRTIDDTPTVESFASHTSMTFDPIAVAEGAADLTLAVLFELERANRLSQYNSRDSRDAYARRACRCDDTFRGPRHWVWRAGESRQCWCEGPDFEALFRLGADPQTPFCAHSALFAKLQSLARSLPADSNGQELKRRIVGFVRSCRIPVVLRRCRLCPRLRGVPLAIRVCFRWCPV
jgi:hypothetical protein